MGEGNKTRILIRSRINGRYVASTGEWSESSKAALAFGRAIDAEAFVRERNLQNMELMIIRDGGATVRIPVRAAAAGGREPPTVGHSGEETQPQL